MSIATNFYRVTILSSGLSTVTPGNGFIELLRAWENPNYNALPSKAPNGPIPGTDIPSSVLNGTSKARGNYRWHQIRKNLSLACSPSYFGDQTDQLGTPGTIDNPPTRIDFTVGYDRVGSLQVYDDLNPGAILVGAAAVKRSIAIVLANTYNVVWDVLDPTFDVNSHRIQGARAVALTVGALANNLTAAEAVITVTQITGID